MTAVCLRAFESFINYIQQHTQFIIGLCNSVKDKFSDAQAAAAAKVSELKEQAEQAAGDLQEKAQGAVADAQAAVVDVQAKAQDAAAGLQEQAQQVAADAQAKVSSLTGSE